MPLGYLGPMFAVTPIDGPIDAVVRPPGSKSITNRALVLAALARPAASRLSQPLEADDSVAMRRSLRGLGVLIDDNDDPWLVLGTGGVLEPVEDHIDVGASGTTARFVTALATLARSGTRVDGVTRMRERPIGPLVDGLRGIGGVLEDTAGFPPIDVAGGGLRGGVVEVDSRQSSQFASALLMVAPMAEEPVVVNLGGPVVSRPYIDGTIDLMRIFGADVTVVDDRFEVAPGGYRKAHLDIEADASAAVYPAVAVAIAGGTVAIEGIPDDSRQPDLAILTVLTEMGCTVVHRDHTISVTSPSDGLRPCDHDFSSAPDGAMAVAVACLFASGPSRLRGLSTLRLKETDRLAALESELSKLGAGVTIDGDSMFIDPGAITGGVIETYDDHRMAMSFALAGLRVPGVEIANPETVAKTWPGFFEMLAGL